MISGTAQTWDNDPFAEFQKRTSLSFPTPGTVHQGVVESIDTDVQGTDPKTGEPATWPKGGPKLNIVIGLDGNRSFWIPKYNKHAKHIALREAQKELGRVIQEGDTLKIAFTGIDPETANDPLPRKLYKAKIEPRALGGNNDPFATPAKQPDDVPF